MEHIVRVGRVRVLPSTQVTHVHRCQVHQILGRTTSLSGHSIAATLFAILLRRRADGLSVAPRWLALPARRSEERRGRQPRYRHNSCCVVPHRDRVVHCLEGVSMQFVRLALLALILVVATPPARAESTTLPPLAPLTSVRWDFVASFNGKPLSFCQEAYESYNRGHARCYQLETVALPEYGINLVAGQVDEVVLYDSMLYQRKNDETLWTASPNPIYPECHPSRSVHGELPSGADAHWPD